MVPLFLFEFTLDKKKASDIVYQYDPLNDKKYKTYKAEDVIANNGDSNTIALTRT